MSGCGNELIPGVALYPLYTTNDDHQAIEKSLASRSSYASPLRLCYGSGCFRHFFWLGWFAVEEYSRPFRISHKPKHKVAPF